jgi:hypothetical protein
MKNLLIYNHKSLNYRGAKTIIENFAETNHWNLIVRKSDKFDPSKDLTTDIDEIYLLDDYFDKNKLTKFSQKVIEFNIPKESGLNKEESEESEDRTEDGTESEETKNSVIRKVWKKFYGELETPLTVNLIHDATVKLNLMTPFSGYFEKCEPLLKDEILKDLIFTEEPSDKLAKWLKIGREVNEVYKERVRKLIGNKELHLLGAIDDEPVVYLDTKGMDDEDLHFYVVELLGAIASMYRITAFYAWETKDGFRYIGVTPTGKTVKCPPSKEFIIKPVE